MQDQPVTVYGVRAINTDNTVEYRDNLNAIYTNREAAEDHIKFAHTCACNLCVPFLHTSYTIIPTVVATGIIISEEPDDEEEEESESA